MEPPGRHHMAALLEETRGKLAKALAELDEERRLRTQALAPGTLQGAPCGDHGCKHAGGCLGHVAEGAYRGFATAYFIRAGLALVARALKIGRKRPASLLDSKQLLSEQALVYREDAVRLGLFLGGFNAVYHGARCILRRCTGEDAPWHAAAAGATAGLTLVLQVPDRQHTLALYLATRLLQSVYNSAKASGKYSVLQSGPVKNGDALLFSLSSAQVMYAFLMRPETLPRSYWSWISRMCPVDTFAVSAMRDNCRGRPLDPEGIAAWCTRHGGGDPGIGTYPPVVPCSVLHPQTPYCSVQQIRVFTRTFRASFPLYLSLNVVPLLVLNLRKFLRHPVRSSLGAAGGAARSTTFLSTFVCIYMATVCAHRKVLRSDHRSLYFLAGLLGGAAVLLEKKSRRSELALYVLPRAADSLYLSLLDRRLVPNVAGSDVAIFCTAMGGLMYYLEQQPEALSPLVRTLLRRIVAGESPPTRSPSSQDLTIQLEHGDVMGTG